VGISGLVDRKNGVSVRFPWAEHWDNVPVGRLLSERFGLPVQVENDVQAATLAHLRFGAGRGVRHFLYLHIGQGIRLGIVADGKLYSGASGKAGEVGHVVVTPEGPVCYCGNYGCLESLAGPSAMVGQAREAIAKGVESAILTLAGGQAEKIDFKAVLEAASQGDRLAGNLVEKSGQHIGQVLANLANVLEPELVIAGGIGTELLKPLVEVITTKFRTVAMPGVRDRVRVVGSEFERFPCSLGAGTLVLEDFFERVWGRA
jgi:predicted NBD/HSP70 family sugar kinase